MPAHRPRLQQGLVTEREQQHTEPLAQATRTTLADGIQLSFTTQGTGPGTPVVFVPGPTDSWLSYATVLDNLPPPLRCFALSQRGHGDSDKPATGFDIAHFAGDLVAFLDAIDVARAVLAGHSGSCFVVRRVAIDYPERVAGLVLEASPTTLAGNAGLAQFVESIVNGLSDPIDSDFARSLVADTSQHVDAETAEVFVTEVLKVPARVWREMFTELLTYDDRDELATIHVPALLVWGDTDGIVDRAMQDELVQHLADPTLVTYAGLGHTPRWEDPARFAADVAAFAARL